ncbi:hypothetical protein KY290_035386 [Solanum tuberosum]|uniref:Protein kinase domain-containing protein n=1 Tax=Solanum tuberosum TaxID=4113 RepID=A0ABQ7U765_SOLTU|nr:hypothetical protein KY290_035386 [Solanum tuberosum]
MDEWEKLYVLGAGSYGKVYYAVKTNHFWLDVSIDNGNIPTYNLFLEYASGGSLHDLIINSKMRRIQMSEVEVGFYAYQLLKVGLSLRVAEGMAYMIGATMSNRGTLPYTPPESLISGFHGKAYDIWSLGCTVAEMMTGCHVWIYRDTRDLQWKIMNEDPVIPSNVSKIARVIFTSV